MNKITVYSMPGCSPCKKVKNWLDSKGVNYTEKDITVDQEAFEHIKSLGFSGVPVVETDIKSWSGINLENMKELVENA